jgi:predicted peroxiredoxin
MTRPLLAALLLGTAIAATSSPCQAQAPTPPITATEARPGLFVNLTTDDPWAASKAVFFTHQRVLRAGYRPATIWLNVRAVYLADRRRASARVTADGPDIQAMLRAFIADGGQVIACQACMGVAGLTAADLIEGVVVGAPDVLMPALMGPNIRTLTW